ncbi:MAG TPA: MEDS domain-containing protein [Candidatus Angelobacter sp.]|nr:MEDS domain-containing protein [Candidatus Angelobacter sp.]
MNSPQIEDPRLLAHLRCLGLHRHLCVIYETPQEKFLAAAPFIRIGLERGERCLYVSGEHKPASVVEAFNAAGIDTATAVKQGSLILAYKEPYLTRGPFDPAHALRLWAKSVSEAKRAGFSALRFAGEVTRTLPGLAGNDHWIDYEVKLDHFLHTHDCLCLCLYNRRRFPPELILNVIRTHPVVVYGGLACKNRYYIPPDESRRHSVPDALIERSLKTLQDLEQAEQSLRELSVGMLQLQEEERRRIARELHDTTSQNLMALVLTLSSLKDPVAALDSHSRKRFSASLGLARQAAREVSTLSFLLHPPLLEGSGLVEALRWYVRGFSRRSGIKVKLLLPRTPVRLPRELEIPLFRIAQEALHNAQRHSGSKQAEIRLQMDRTRAVLEVRDFGRGLSLPKKSTRNALYGSHTLGVGILGMRERIQQLGGTLQLTPVQPGTLLRAAVPTPNPKEAA